MGICVSYHLWYIRLSGDEKKKMQNLWKSIKRGIVSLSFLE